jgi:uracil phosphoribosyltransferase
MDIFQIVPILRAGLALADLATSILPSTRTFHLGEKKNF